MFPPPIDWISTWGKKENFALLTQIIHITQFQAHSTNVNVNGKMIPLLEVNIRENLHDLGVGEIFKQAIISTNCKGKF